MARYGTSRIEGVTGFGWLASMEFLHYGWGMQAHIERMTHLWKQTAYAKGFIPVHIEGRPKDEQEDYKKEIFPLIEETDKLLAQLIETYDPAFEGVRTCTAKEKQFLNLDRAILERNVEIWARSRILDGIRPSNEQMEPI